MGSRLCWRSLHPDLLPTLDLCSHEMWLDSARSVGSEVVELRLVQSSAECFAGQRYPTGGVMSHSCFIQGLLIAEKAA